MRPSQPQVFISYHHTDETFARQVRTRLEAHGVKTWMDRYDIAVGAYWTDEIDKGLAASDIVLGVLSPDSVESRNVKNEWDWAIQNGKRLLLIQAQPCVIPHRYVSINFIDATGDVEMAIRQLAAVLQRHDLPAPHPQDGVATQNRSPIALDSDASPASGDTRAARSNVQFVGRKRELFELCAGLEQALAGNGGLLLLAGEPGIGKTRTAVELAHIAMDRGARVIWGRCNEWEGSPSYWPWLQVIRTLIADFDEDGIRELLGPALLPISQIMPELRETISNLPDTPIQDPEQARFRLFDALAILLQRIARAQPLVLILDDVHWSDRPSLLLLEFLASSMGSMSVLLVATYRNVEVSRQHPLARTLAELARQQPTQRVLMQGWTRLEVEQFLEAAFGAKPPAQLVDRVECETEGNPFFVSEVAHLLAAERGDGQLLDARSVRVPESVREVIGRRLVRLSEDANRILTTASVIGRDFNLSILERVSDVPLESLLDLMDEALAAHVIEVGVSIGHYRFSHALIRETLYEEMSTTRRLRLHGRIVTALQDVPAHSASLADLAYHAFQAAPLGDARQAVDYSTRAAELALAQLAWEEAVGHYDRALQALKLLDRPDQHEQLELLIALGKTQMASGDVYPGTATLRRAEALARQMGSIDHLVQIALSSHAVGYWIFQFGDDAFIKLLEDTLSVLPTGDSPERARLTARLVSALGNRPGSLSRRIALAEQALAMARRLGDFTIEALALVCIHMGLQEPNAWEFKRRVTDDLVRLAREHREHADADPHLAWAAVNAASIIPMDGGDLTAAVRMIDEALRVVERMQLHGVVAVAVKSVHVGQVLVEGRFAEAELLEDESYQINLIVNPNAWQSGYERASVHYLLHRDRGDLHRAEAIAREHRARDHTDMYWHSRVILLDADAGRFGEVRRELDAVLADGGAALSDGPWWWTAAAMLAEACWLLGDGQHARTLYAILQPFAGRHINELTIFYGACDHYLALLAAVMGDTATAVVHFETALAFNASPRLNARPLVARGQQAYAAMLWRRNAPGDTERARDLAAGALALSNELGMPLVAERARDILAALPASGRDGSQPDRHGLSPRELDVLQGLVAGQSNQEIAATLFISPRTVESHVANILGKLGLDSRAAVAVYAVRQGLV